MNRESVYNAIMAEASRVYREATVEDFAVYVHACELAGQKYKSSTGDVLEAQDVCRGEIEDAGDVYGDAVFIALTAYLDRRNDALEAYRNT
jgi:hypothetical protein